MPELNFEITGVEPAHRGLAPLLHFKLRITAQSESEKIHAVLLQAQIHIGATGRSYSPGEKERLAEIFGTPERWGQTLRGKFWCHANTTTGAFTGGTETVLSVPCSYDLNILSAKYFSALEQGEIPLEFLCSGSIFYAGEDGRLQVQPISWDKECSYRIPVRLWKDLMDHHFPNSAWIVLHRDVFEELNGFKRENGIATWDDTIARLLATQEEMEVQA
jgi:hypothetical protein